MGKNKEKAVRSILKKYQTKKMLKMPVFPKGLLVVSDQYYNKEPILTQIYSQEQWYSELSNPENCRF